MAFSNMWFELSGELGIPTPLAQTYINEALNTIYDDQMWSFQLGESGWLTPGLLFPKGSQSSGTITATAYQNTIVGDATASAQWLAYANAGTKPLLSQLQIRQPAYSLYNVVSFDGINTLTLDRPWMEPSGTGLAYMMYQAYFAAPVADFKRFFEIRDTTNNQGIDFWTKSRTDLAVEDAQRQVFNLPSYVVPYEVDNRANSPTAGYMLYELWPHPLSSLPYSYSYLRRGAALVFPSDTVPSPLTEDMVKWKAKESAYLFKESQKGDAVARGSGADWRFLAASAGAEYEKTRKRIAARDRDLAELYFKRFVRNVAAWGNGEPFATVNSQLNVGRF